MHEIFLTLPWYIVLEYIHARLGAVRCAAGRARAHALPRRQQKRVVYKALWLQQVARPILAPCGEAKGESFRACGC